MNSNQLGIVRLLSLFSIRPSGQIPGGKPEPIKQLNPWDDIVSSVKEETKKDVKKSVGETWLESTATSLLIDTTPPKVIDILV